MVLCVVSDANASIEDFEELKVKMLKRIETCKTSVEHRWVLSTLIGKKDSGGDLLDGVLEL